MLAQPNSYQVRFSPSYGNRKDALNERLTYLDKKFDYEIKAHKKNRWFAQKHGEAAHRAKLEELKAAQKKSLLFEDADGLWTYSGLAPMLAAEFDDKLVIGFKRPEPKAIPWAKTPDKKLRYYQEEALEKLLEAGHAGVEIGCHRKGEKILMFSGELKAVEDVVVGDQLMGPDSTPRTVEELKRGIDTMYRVEAINGQTMHVNGHHILSLRRTNHSNKEPTGGKKRRVDYKGKNPIVNIAVEDYLAQSKYFRHTHKLYSVGVNFPHRDVPMDPYILGLLLGDGHLFGTPAVASADEPIEKALVEFALTNGFTLRRRRESGGNQTCFDYSISDGGAGRKENRLTGILRDLKLWNTTSANKFIPDCYKFSSRENRLQILAGLIDTDGSLAYGCFDYVSKSQQLADDVAFLARSLGLRARVTPTRKKSPSMEYMGDYWRVCISGDIDSVPVRLDRKKAGPRRHKRHALCFGFTVEKVADAEEYYGFVLDQDHLYLTDTFLVTHNTGLGKSVILMHLCKRLGLKAVVMAPSISIAEQLYREFAEAFGKKYVGAYFDGKKQHDKLFVVAVAASLTKINEGSDAWESLTKADVFIADESHMCPAKTLAKVCFGLCANASYRFFFSGTQLRSDGLDLLLDAITGPIVYRMTVQEGVDQGFLARPEFRMLRLNSDVKSNSDDPNELTRLHVYYNPQVTRAAADFANRAVSLMNRPTLILVDELEQFSQLLPFLRFEARFAHGGVNAGNKEKVPPAYHDSDPSKLVDAFNQGAFPILVGTSCITTGTDIRNVKCTIYLRGGKSEIEVKQSVGRCTRKPPGKEDCLFVDFAIDNVPMLKRHADARKTLYAEIYPSYKEIKL